MADLVLNVLLLFDQSILRHDVLVKCSSLLLKARLEESLTHVLDNDFGCGTFDTSEFNPLAKEARSEFNSILEIEAVVLGATENRQQELGHPHLVAASVFEHRGCNQEDQDVAHSK